MGHHALQPRRPFHRAPSRRSFQERPPSRDRRPPPSARGSTPKRRQTTHPTLRQEILDLALPELAKVAQCPRHRRARHRRPLASSRVPRVLAMALKGDPGSPSHSQASHQLHQENLRREPLLGRHAGHVGLLALLRPRRPRAPDTMRRPRQRDEVTPVGWPEVPPPRQRRDLRSIPKFKALSLRPGCLAQPGHGHPRTPIASE